jgi:hypothetical protein
MTSSGKYDYDFMDYTIRVLRKCKEYGFKVYMDPHQDVVRILICHKYHLNLILYSVVALLWGLWRTILDSSSLWHQPSGDYPDTLCYRPLRMAKCERC